MDDQKQKSERYKRRKRRRMLPWIAAAALLALLGIFIALLFVILTPKGKEQKESSTTPEAAVETSAESIPVEVVVPEDETTPDADESSPEEQTEEENTENTETETEAPTEATPEPTPEDTQPEPAPAPAPGSPDYQKVAFIGDSRILYMGSGKGKKYAGLVPNDCISATSGAQANQGVAHEDAVDAAVKQKEIAVFWYGINDVQVNYQRDDADFFINSLDSVIRTYQSANTSNSRICILSVLSTGTQEKDWYPEQDANIKKYNKAIKNLCKEKGYTYLDVTDLFTGDACLLDDHIHFTKEWYQDSLLPYLANKLGI